MFFYIQDIQDGYNETLLDVLTSSSIGAVEGGGTFAFVTEIGVHKFLENEKMESILNKGKYKLIVGTDKVTDLKAIARLDKLQKYFNGLNVNAFLNNSPNVLYHPKVNWFKYEDGARLIVGSGNLTESGLSKNIEMFVVRELNNEEFIAFKNKWDNWIDINKENIRLLDDEEICEKVKNNQIMYEKVKEKVSSKDKGKYKDIIVESLIEALVEEDFNEEVIKNVENINDDIINKDILIHEISKNGDRFSQMNFNLEVVLNFFDVGSNSTKRFKEINLNGSLAREELRKFVQVLSHNYRFELNGLIGQNYPKNGRPIAIFQKMNSNQYTYAIIMPGDIDFNDLKQFLYKYTHITRKDRMKVCYTNQYELKKEVSNLRIFK